LRRIRLRPLLPPPFYKHEPDAGGRAGGSASGNAGGGAGGGGERGADDGDDGDGGSDDGDEGDGGSEAFDLEAAIERLDEELMTLITVDPVAVAAPETPPDDSPAVVSRRSATQAPSTASPLTRVARGLMLRS